MGSTQSTWGVFTQNCLKTHKNAGCYQGSPSPVLCLTDLLFHRQESGESCLGLPLPPLLHCLLLLLALLLQLLPLLQWPTLGKEEEIRLSGTFRSASRIWVLWLQVPLLRIWTLLGP